jgi:hypothetical protein
MVNSRRHFPFVIRMAIAGAEEPRGVGGPGCPLVCDELLAPVKHSIVMRVI